MKCSACGEKLETTFLEKPLGTLVKDGKKGRWFCSNCQKGKTKDELLA